MMSSDCEPINHMDDVTTRAFPTSLFWQVEFHYDSNSTSSNPAPPLQNHMFSLEKRGFGDDSGDSLDDSPGSKAAHKTTQHLQAWTCMDRQESQSNWPNMRKTLGKPGFLSGEDRNRTTREIHRKIDVSKRGVSTSDARINDESCAGLA